MGCLALMAPSVAFSSEAPVSPLRRTDVALAVLFLVLGGALRLGGLGWLPMDLDNDEGINGLVALDILNGKGPGPVLRAYSDGEEAATFYLQALSMRLLGRSIETFRLPTALVCSFAVPLMYLAIRRSAGTFTSALTALLLCFSCRHLYFSRVGNSMGYVVTFELLALFFLAGIQRSARFGNYVGLGLALGLGLHTYPAFRIVPPLLVASLLWTTWLDRRDRLRPRLLGLLATVGLVALFLAPFLSSPETFHLYLNHLQVVTALGLPPIEGAFSILTRLPASLASSLAAVPMREGAPLRPPAVALLMLLGLVAVVVRACRARSRPCSRQDEPPPPTMTSSMLLVLLFLIVIPPLVVVEEAEAPRRHLLSLAPALLLAGVGLQALRARFAGSLAGEWLHVPVDGLLALFVIGVTATQPFELFIQGRNNPRLQQLLSVARLDEAPPLVIPLAAVRYPNPSRGLATAPEVDFVLDAAGLPLAKGRNPYPTVPRSDRVWFLLGAPGWERLLESEYPEGKVVLEMDRHRFQAIRFYEVPGEVAFRHQGLKLESSGPSGVMTCRVADVTLEGLTLAGDCVHRWSGALYVPATGQLRFELAARGAVVLSIGQRRADDAFGTCRIFGWFAEGWYPVTMTLRTGAEGSRTPVLRWMKADDERWSHFPRWQFLDVVPARQELLARPLAERQCGVAWRKQFQLPAYGPRWTDAAFADDRVLLLGPDRTGLLALDLDGRALPPPLGQDDAARLRIPDWRLGGSFLSEVAASGRGDMVILNALSGDVLLKRGQTPASGMETVGGLFLQPVCAAFSEARQVWFVADRGHGEVRRFAADGTLLPSWPLAGVTALCADPAGGLHAVVPDRSGIVSLSADGKETACWRDTELSELSLIACDRQGPVFVTTAHAELRGYSSEGEVLMTGTPIPALPGGPQGAFCRALKALSSGRLALALHYPVVAWTLAEVVSPEEAAAAPAAEVRVLSGAGE